MNQAVSPAMSPILIIEDEDSVMFFLCSALERNGYRTVRARNGSEGLSLLQKGDYTGVISDMRTPGGITGADVHAWIIENRPELGQRLLFITGDTVNPETAAILQKTGVPCIEKPFRVNELLNAVQRVIPRTA